MPSQFPSPPNPRPRPLLGAPFSSLSPAACAPHLSSPLPQLEPFAMPPPLLLPPPQRPAASPPSSDAAPEPGLCRKGSFRRRPLSGGSAAMHEEVIRQRDIELEGKDVRIRDRPPRRGHQPQRAPPAGRRGLCRRRTPRAHGRRGGGVCRRGAAAAAAAACLGRRVASSSAACVTHVRCHSPCMPARCPPPLPNPVVIQSPPLPPHPAPFTLASAVFC